MDPRSHVLARQNKQKCKLLAVLQSPNAVRAANDSSRIDPLRFTASSAPHDAPSGHLALRQTKQPGRRRGVDASYDVPALGPFAVRAPAKSRQAAREERVLCKSVLSPQREPIGESIIRRVKSPMLPEFRFDFPEFLPAGQNFQKISSSDSHTISTATRKQLRLILKSKRGECPWFRTNGLSSRLSQLARIRPCQTDNYSSMIARRSTGES